MTTIAQRTLRNDVSHVLRRAEAGESFTITVDGRPVAELGPVGAPGRPAAPDRLAAVLSEAPADLAWARELERERAADDDVAVEPWAD